jgi:hypothetical protein
LQVRRPGTWAKAAAVIALAVVVEAVGMKAYRPGELSMTLSSLLFYLVALAFSALLAAASVAISGSLSIGLAIALSPLSLMGPGPAGVLAYASALTASLAAIFTYLLAGLRSRVLTGPHVNVNLITLSAPNAAALASASLTTYMAWLVRLPLVSPTYVGQWAYAALSLGTAVIASLTARGYLDGLLRGSAALLGPLGFVLLLTIVKAERS